MSRKICLIIGTAALAGAAVALRLAAVPPALPDLDAANFAASLGGFDLRAQAPHFPGYPLYVAASRLVFAMGAREVVALSLPGILLGGAATATVVWAAKRSAGIAAGFGSGAVFAFAPMAVLAGGNPTSDGVGVAVLAIALALHVMHGETLVGKSRRPARVDPGDVHGAGAGILSTSAASRRRSAAALGLVAAAAIGFRPSLTPAVALLFLALPASRRLAWFLGAAAGIAAWLGPVVMLTGGRTFATIATGFLAGHGSSWGGTIASQPDLAGRLHAFAFDLFAANLAWPWPGLGGGSRWLAAGGFAVAAVALLRGWRTLGAGERRLLRVALLSCAPYALWAFVGQNLEKPRHLLPLVPGVALAFGAALSALRSSRPARAFGFRAGPSPAGLGGGAPSRSLLLGAAASDTGRAGSIASEPVNQSLRARRRRLIHARRARRALVSFARLRLARVREKIHELSVGAPARVAPVAAVAVAAGLVATALPVSLAQGREPSPGAALALDLRARLHPANTMLFTGQEGRLVERYAPEFRAGRIADPAGLEPEARRLAAAGVNVYFTSAAPGASRLGAELLQEVARFAAPHPGLSSSRDLILYRFLPAAPAEDPPPQRGADSLVDAPGECPASSTARPRLAGLPAKVSG